MTDLVLATRNRHKGEELSALLSDLQFRIRTLAEFPAAPEVVEDGATCRDNAVKKAVAIAHATGLPAVADDTGLEVEALDGRPGVHAARYAGEGATYADNCRKLLRELEGFASDRRTATFLTVAALALPDGTVEVTEGRLRGRITTSPEGTQGFGYDPVFFVPTLGRTLAQLSPEEKNQVSHRAEAFRKMKEVLSRLKATHS